MTIYDDVRFWLQVLGDTKRTIICPPELESRIKSGLRARGLDGLNKVVASRSCPDGQIFIADEQGLEASTRAALQRYRWEQP